MRWHTCAGLVADSLWEPAVLVVALGTISSDGLRISGMTTDARSAANGRDTSGDTVDSWLAIGPTGAVTLYVGKVELGTGLQTALTQIAAEELDVAFDRVTIVQGDTALTPNQGTTAGSKSVQTAGPLIRNACAHARQVLLERASARLEIAVADLTVTDGVVYAIADRSRAIPYGDLVAEPFGRSLSGDVQLKSPADYTIVGQSMPRVDLFAKLTGAPAYVQDVELDGMLHGRVVRPYVRTMDGVAATITAFDDAVARRCPGVVAVVRNGDFVGVVAEREEQAIAASRAIAITWSEPTPLLDETTYFEQISHLVIADNTLLETGDVDTRLMSASRTLEAWYQFPMQAHAPVGPSCAVADVRADSATIYSHSQGVYYLRDAVAPLLGFEPEGVQVIYREGAGCYGHVGADDVAADAALLSQEVGKPVRVQWMREDEFAWEPKSPAMRSHLRAGLDDTGAIVAWEHEVWTPTHVTRSSGKPGNLFAGQLIDPPAPKATNGNGGGDRNASHNYDIPNQRVAVYWTQPVPLRPSAMRSLGGLANSNANESFIDELAVAANSDPIAFRLRHLTDRRAVEVLTRVADVAGWQPRPSGPISGSQANDEGVMVGRGVAFVRYETKYAYAAVVANVTVNPTTGEIRVTDVTVAHDCGLIVNPDGVRNQIEGNVIQGISRTLKETVTWDRQAVTSLDWDSYPVIRFPEIPTITIDLIDRPDEPSWGAGEIAICPVAPAITNAIFDATGCRLRTVPYTPERMLAALRSP